MTAAKVMNHLEGKTSITRELLKVKRSLLGKVLVRQCGACILQHTCINEHTLWPLASCVAAVTPRHATKGRHSAAVSAGAVRNWNANAARTGDGASASGHLKVNPNTENIQALHVYPYG